MSEEGAVAFTDIVGFTEFCAVRGDDEALALLSLQERLVRNALPPGARIVKELGDGLLLWFPVFCTRADGSQYGLHFYYQRFSFDDWSRLTFEGGICSSGLSPHPL